MECSICQAKLCKLHTLPCHHYCCGACLEGLQQNNGSIECPSCKTTSPSETVQDLPNSLCDRGHTTNSQMCSDHEEPFKLYCLTCDQLICRDCTIIDHVSHQYDFVKKIAPQVRASLYTETSPLRELSVTMETTVEHIRQNKADIHQQHNFVQEHIKQKFSEMMATLQVREKELLTDTEQLVQQKLWSLDQQEAMISARLTKVCTVLDYIDSSLQKSADEELLTAHRDLSQRAKSVETDQLVPLETANIAVKIATNSELQTLLRDKASVYVFPADDQVHMSMVGAPTTHHITDISATEHTTSGTHTASLRSLVDGSSLSASVIQTGKGLYEVTYTPQVRGRHELMIAVNGVSIGTRLVFVTMPPALLGPLPIRTLTDFKHPFAVQFDRDGHLLVTESSGNKIKRAHRQAKELVQNGHFMELCVTNPTGLAIDTHTGAVYVASGNKNIVYKYSTKGELMCTSTIDMDHPSGLTLLDNHLFVCDRNNSRILVFSSTLHHLQTFGSHGNKCGQLRWPYDIVSTESGNLIVSDCDNHRLQEFTSQGDYVTCHRGNLKRPMGLCAGMTGDLYVTGFENHQLCVLNEQGQSLCTLGKYGMGPGDMCYPTDVAIDSDGFVYVCDQGNNRVLVY